jgi:predicted aminopeptidase
MYAVVYRIGTPEACEWVRMQGYFSREAAQAEAEVKRREGYKALVHKAHMLDSIGLPEGWE